MVVVVVVGVVVAADAAVADRITDSHFQGKEIESVVDD